MPRKKVDYTKPSRPNEEWIVAAKDANVNIRTGPGMTYPTTGLVVDKSGTILVEEENGWGLLKEHQTSRDGWVNLEYVIRIP